MRVYMNKRLRSRGAEFSPPRQGDAGYDLVAIEDHTLAPLERAAIKTGLHVEIPAGCVGIVKDRSSLALRGLHCLAGVIDSAYRGEIHVILVNLGAETCHINAGQRIAQLLILGVVTPAIETVPSLDSLSSTARGSGGFGSTGE